MRRGSALDSEPFLPPAALEDGAPSGRVESFVTYAPLRMSAILQEGKSTWFPRTWSAAFPE